MTSEIPPTLTPFRADDPVKPGRVGFLCHNTTIDNSPPRIQNYWLGLVCTEEILPKTIREARPPNTRQSNAWCPVWLIGRQHFLWTRKLQMYYLNDSQAYAFAGTAEYGDFATYFTLAQEQREPKRCLEFFRHDIRINALKIDQTVEGSQVELGRRVGRGALLRRRRPERKAEGHREREVGLFCPDDEELAELDEDDEKYAKRHTEDEDEDEEESHISTPLFVKRRKINISGRDSGVRKPSQQAKVGTLRSRTASSSNTFGRNISMDSTPAAGNTVTAPATPSAVSSASTAIADPASGLDAAATGVPKSPVIKPEPSEDMNLPPSPNTDTVVIYAGPRNTQFMCTKPQLLQSPLLTSYLTNQAGGSSYVMHPHLGEVDADDFEVLVQWLRSGEYTPLLIQETRDAVVRRRGAVGTDKGISRSKTNMALAPRNTRVADIDQSRANTPSISNSPSSANCQIQPPPPPPHRAPTPPRSAAKVKWTLDSITTSASQATELRRSGRLFLLAERFEVIGFADLIFRKVTLGLDGLKDVRAVLELAGCVFGRPDRGPQLRPGFDDCREGRMASRRLNDPGTLSSGIDDLDYAEGDGDLHLASLTDTDAPLLGSLPSSPSASPLALPPASPPVSSLAHIAGRLETHLVDLIADNLQVITQDPRSVKLMWDVFERGRRRNGGQRVWQRKADQYKVWGGEVVKIEDEGD